MADNKDTVRKIEAAWNKNDLAALDQHFAASFDNSTSGVPGLPAGLPGSKMAHGMVMKAFPDRKVQILDIVGEGDRVAVRNRITGTNTGGAAFLGAPQPNGAKIDFESWSIYQLKDGKVVAHWGINDGVKGMIQLGAMKPPM